MAYASAAMDSAGNFLITWVNLAIDSEAKIYNANGSLRADFHYGSDGQQRGGASLDDNGTIVLSWDSGNEVYSQRFHAADNLPYWTAGTALEPAFRVNTTISGSQGTLGGDNTRNGPSVTSRGGNFVVVWGGNGVGDNSGIFGQRYSSIVPAAGPSSALISAGPSPASSAIGQSAASSAQTALGPVGGEFLINSTATGDQIAGYSFSNGARSVDIDSAGRFVAVWQGNGPGDASGVFAQRYAADGTTQGAEFRVNTTTAGTQTNAQVAVAAASGSFVVAWDGPGVRAQVVNANGVPVGGEVIAPINKKTTSVQLQAVSADANGNFILVYRTYESQGPSTNRYVNIQRYNSSGQPQGSTIRYSLSLVNGSISSAMAGNGNFVVAWNEVANGQTVVYAQRYSASGATVGSRLTAATGGTQGGTIVWQASAAMDPAGNFVVAWENQSHDRGARFYSADGTPLASMSYGAASQQRGGVTLDNGTIAFSWQSGGDVYAQRFNAVDGAPLDAAPFVVNTTVSGDQGTLLGDSDYNASSVASRRELHRGLGRQRRGRQ